jgi:NAD(P)-dependent dehydrogenase (short-subunit alcohol dehydrogenase family)
MGWQAYLKGKIAIITGGASGIGAAMARALAQSGAEVVVADRQVDLAGQLADGLQREGARATAHELDVRDFDSIKRLVDATVARTGRVDLFFNNAGIAIGGEMDRYQKSYWDDTFDVNLRGVAYGVQAVYPVMVAQRSGHIINTASMAGLVATAGGGAYTATKHAVVGLSKALRIEARAHGVRVSVLCPGAIRTPILTGGRFGGMDFPGASEKKILSIWEWLRPLDPDEFARRALRAVAANEPIIVVPRWWKIAWYLDRVSPWVALKLGEVGAHVVRRELRLPDRR